MAAFHNAGWALFLVFAGVGFVALPMDLVREWWGRPRATIARSEYVTRAMGMAKNAQRVKVLLLDKTYTHLLEHDRTLVKLFFKYL